jgi:hypothetical protein
MKKKLQATVDPTGLRGVWTVTVTDDETGEVTVVKINAATEGEAAFKGMDEVDGR